MTESEGTEPATLTGFHAADGLVKCSSANDDVVAKYDGTDITIKKGYGKYRDAIEAAVNAAPPASAASESPEPLDPAAKASAKVAKILAERDEKPDGVVEEGRIEAAKYAADVEDDKAFAKRAGCPPPPLKNPQFGDKTPAYVDWLRTHRPAKYDEKYGVERRDQRIPIYGEDGNVIRHEVRDVGTRKTHLSEKIERDPTLDPSMDWDA